VKEKEKKLKREVKAKVTVLREKIERKTKNKLF